jgi:hypothetical protein
LYLNYIKLATIQTFAETLLTTVKPQTDSQIMNRQQQQALRTGITLNRQAAFHFFSNALKKCFIVLLLNSSN